MGAFPAYTRAYDHRRTVRNCAEESENLVTKVTFLAV